MKIDSSRFKLFCTNPEQYRLQELWKLVPIESDTDTMTSGRRRGTAFHELTDGKEAEELAHLGDKQVETAVAMFRANESYGADTEVLWKEKEFDIDIPNSPHRMVGRIDSRVRRGGEEFILDFKTTRMRTQLEMQAYRDELQQNPQVDFYLCAEPDLRKMIYRVLWKKPFTRKSGSGFTIQIEEVEVYRETRELRLFQRYVHMVCETVEMWKREFGIEQPWPRAIKLPVSPQFYGYAPIYQRAMYEGAEREGFTEKVEHLACLREGL